MPVTTTSRKCSTCGEEFVLTRRDKRHCSRICRYRAANQRKGESRKAIIERNGGKCTFCRRSTKRPFVHWPFDVLCGACHLELYRIQVSLSRDTPLVGRRHRGIFFVSIDEVLAFADSDALDNAQAALLNQVQSALATGDFQEQLCAYLDGEAPHPLEEDLSLLYREAIYINPFTHREYYRQSV